MVKHSLDREKWKRVGVAVLDQVMESGFHVTMGKHGLHNVNGGELPGPEAMGFGDLAEHLGETAAATDRASSRRRSRPAGGSFWTASSPSSRVLRARARSPADSARAIRSSAAARMEASAFSACRAFSEDRPP